MEINFRESLETPIEFPEIPSSSLLRLVGFHVFFVEKAMKTTIYGLPRTFGLRTCGSTEFEREKRRKIARFLRFGARSATNS
jgi:hypothetical protein